MDSIFKKSDMKNRHTLKYVWLFLCLLPSSSFQAQSATRTANSMAELQIFINSAQPGDIIYLAKGTYLNNSLIVRASNIVISAIIPGSVILSGTNTIVISGDSNALSGFQFKSGNSSGPVINVKGSSNRLTQLNFSGYSAPTYVVFQDGTQHNEVSYSNFEDKPASAPAGDLIHVAAHATIPGYHKIRYSSFQNMQGAGGDYGNENIRLSNGAQSTYVSRTLVEFNYFSNTGKGDSEAISVKCRENVLRFNTFKNNPDAMMVFRNGNDNIAYGNYFIDSGGIRIKEANNIYIYNNYFERSGVGGTMNAVSYDYVSGNLKNINFIHNTFVESGKIDLSSGATANTWTNNIFVKSSGELLSGSTFGITWTNNLYWGSALAPIQGMTNIDPKLGINSDGYFGLLSDSPAINAGSDKFPNILDVPNIDDDPTIRYDNGLQLRDSRKDIGADEYVIGDQKNRPLTLSDVGPSYLGGPSSHTTQP